MSRTKFGNILQTSTYIDASISNVVTGGTGDITGPSTSTTNAIALYSDTTGKVLKSDSTVAINSTNNITNVNSIATNSYRNNSGNSAIEMSTGVASDITLNTTQYKGATNIGKILSLDTNGKLIPVENKLGDVLSNTVSADNTLCRYDGVNNKTIQQSNVILDDAGNLTGINSLVSTLNPQFTGTNVLSLIASPDNTSNTSLSGVNSLSNILLGSNTGRFLTTTSGKNVMVGSNIGLVASNNVSNNILVGDDIKIGQSADNIMIGRSIGNTGTNSSCIDNVILGRGCAPALSSGSNNVIIGRGAASLITTGFQNTILGFGANVSAGVNNSVAIGQGARANANDEYVHTGTVHRTNLTNQCDLGSTAVKYKNAYFSGLVNANTLTAINTTSTFVNTDNRLNSTGNAGYQIAPNTTGRTIYTGSDYKNATADGLVSFASDGTLQKNNVATLDSSGNLLFNSLNGVSGTVLINGTVQLSSALYTTIPDRILKLNANGTIERSIGGSCDIAGNIGAASLACNILSNATGTANIVLTNTSVGDITLSGSKYGPAENNKGLSLQAGVITPIVLDDTGTGLISGGLITIASATTYNITAGTADIIIAGIKTPISWATKSNITLTTIAAGLQSYIGINSSGNEVVQISPFSPFQQKTIIVLGVLIHVNNTSINHVNTAAHIKYNTVNQLHDLMHVVGPINVSGNLFSGINSTFTIMKTAGSLFKIGSNYSNMSDPTLRLTGEHIIANPILSTVNFQYRFRNGTSLPVTGTRSNIDVDIYDNGASTPAVVGVGNWTVQRMYLCSGNTIKIALGQDEHNNRNQALNSIGNSAYIVEPSLRDNCLLRGFIVVQQGRPHLNHADFIPSNKFGDNSTVSGGVIGDVLGPGVSIDNSISRYDGLTGKLVKGSNVIIDNANSITGVVNLAAATIRSNTLSNATGTANIVLTDTSVGDVTLSGSKYGTAENGKFLTLQSGILTPVVIPISAALNGIFTDFRIKLQGSTEAVVSVYITKLDKMINIAFPTLSPVFTATTTAVESYIVSHADLQPDPVHLIRDFVSSTPDQLTSVKMLGTTGSHYLEFTKSANWTVASGAIYPFTLSYQTTTNTLPTTGVWGTAYKPYAGPPLLSPNIAGSSEILQSTFVVSSSSNGTSQEAFRAFDSNLSNGWESGGIYNTGTGLPAVSTVDRFDPLTGAQGGASGAYGAFIKVTLPVEKSFSYFALNQVSTNVVQFKLYGSNSGTSYALIHDQSTDYVYPSPGSTAYAPNITFTSVSYKYIILQVVRLSSSNRVDIREMKIG
jgi:hypothetical protein